MVKDMTKKKVVTQDMSEFGGFDDLMGKVEDSATLGVEALESVPSKKKPAATRAKKGASAGCRVGYTRHTYVLPEKMVEQVKAIAQHFGITEVSAAEQIIQKGVEEIIKEHGNDVAIPLKPKSLFKK